MSGLSLGAAKATAIQWAGVVYDQGGKFLETATARGKQFIEDNKLAEKLEQLKKDHPDGYRIAKVLFVATGAIVAAALAAELVKLTLCGLFAYVAVNVLDGESKRVQEIWNGFHSGQKLFTSVGCLAAVKFVIIPIVGGPLTLAFAAGAGAAVYYK